MENNEITMLMDVKIDKRPEIIRFQQWTRSQVKIEAVKCFPCFLRISLQTENSDKSDEQENFTISIYVPGVSITLASSRTKQHSYALCWTQNRKNCFIYFALDSEQNCRRHMKWMRKSIKNLELHRKILIEERRISRGGGGARGGSYLYAFPQLTFEDFKDSSWPEQRVSEIYEEIFEDCDPQELTAQIEKEQQQQDSRRISRRCSRSSIASGIYEEMKFQIDSPLNFDAINEELPTTPVNPIPPPIPPLPPQRKRFNTYENEELTNSPPMETIPRCSTNPETDLAKKKKYKNMLGLFHGNGLRSKRTVSTTSESSHEHLTTPKQTKAKAQNKSVETNKKVRTLSPTQPNLKTTPIYANDDIIAAKRQKKPERSVPIFDAAQSKRNSFSSPDLSKINFIDTFDEQRIAELLNPSFLKCDDLELTNSASLDESVLVHVAFKTKTKPPLLALEVQNISTQLPNNFNFSACNSSSVNLIAPLSIQATETKVKTPKNTIILDDDITGYCVMAPIVRKMSSIDNTPFSNATATAPAALPVKPLETVSSGYSTGSYNSAASSTGEQQVALKNKITEESVVYMDMQEPMKLKEIEITNFTGNLYENLLALKAARELEIDPIKSATVLSTSTPTESPLLQDVIPINTTTTSTTTTTTPTSTKIVITTEEGENYYQTPRKSIISIDEKIPSYYPNTCETSVKLRRRSYSPAKVNNKNLGIEKTPTTTTTTSNVVEKSPAVPNSATSINSGFRQLVSSKLRRERKENLYLTSPQTIKVTSEATPATKSIKTKKTAAHKISENVYAVKHRLKKSVTDQTENECFAESNNNIETKSLTDLPDALEHLIVLQNIDFKFEDTKALNLENDYDQLPASPSTPIRAPLSPCHQQNQHHLKTNQSSNTCHKLRACSVGNSPASTSKINSPTTIVAMTQSAITKTTGGSNNTNETTNLTSGVKKFTSLPRFKKFDLSPLRIRINNVLQRHNTPDL